MVPRKMDCLFAGRRKQDDSPHGDRYKRTSVNDLQHDYGNHSPSRSKRSSLPTQRYVSLLTKRKAILGSHDSRNDDVSLSESDTSDDDDSSYRDEFSDDKSNDLSPLLIERTCQTKLDVYVNCK